MPHSKKPIFKICIIAGEASGDNIGGGIITELKARYPGAKFYGVGGQKMLEAGLTHSFFPMEKISLMGFAEIVPHIFALFELLRKTTQFIVGLKPDVVITIDSPGFNNRLAARVKTLMPAQKIVHIVAPSVWAYMPSRAKKIAKIYDLLLTLLPFEPPYFEKYGLESKFIGHPIFTRNFSSSKKEFCRKYDIDANKTLICITPGSRGGEIKRHLPIFFETLSRLWEIKGEEIYAVFCLSNAAHLDFFDQYRAKHHNFRVILDDNISAYGAADIALTKSGTNNLEIAAAGTPQIIAYKMHHLTFMLIKRLIKVRFACLVNIMSGREIIPEFIQDKCTTTNLLRGLLELIDNKFKAELQVAAAQEILTQCGFKQNINPSAVAAESIIQLLRNQ